MPALNALTELDLSGSRIASLRGMPVLPQLKAIIIRNGQIEVSELPADLRAIIKNVNE
jgi:hypothetical protein